MVLGPNTPDHLEMADTRRVINLTPHPVVIYPADVPDRLDPATVRPAVTLDPVDRDRPARIEAVYSSAGPVWPPPVAVASSDPDCGGHRVRVQTRNVTYGNAVVNLPEPHPDWLYLVSMPVALASSGRADLLVVDREVRSMAGTVIGCRGLARVSPSPEPRPQVRQDQAEGARLWADVDRCEHGRHYGDVCGSGCVGGVSLGHPATRDGQPAVIAYGLDGGRWMALAGCRGHAIFVPSESVASS